MKYKYFLIILFYIAPLAHSGTLDGLWVEDMEKSFEKSRSYIEQSGKDPELFKSLIGHLYFQVNGEDICFYSEHFTFKTKSGPREYGPIAPEYGKIHYLAENEFGVVVKEVWDDTELINMYIFDGKESLGAIHLDKNAREQDVALYFKKVGTAKSKTPCSN